MAETAISLALCALVGLVAVEVAVKLIRIEPQASYLRDSRRQGRLGIVALGYTAMLIIAVAAPVILANGIEVVRRGFMPVQTSWTGLAVSAVAGAVWAAVRLRRR